MKQKKRYVPIALGTGAVLIAATVCLLPHPDIYAFRSAFSADEVRSLREELFGKEVLDEDEAATADLNGDGKLDAADLTLMKRGTEPATEDFFVTAIQFGSSSVTLTNALDETVLPEDAENVTVTDGTYVCITQPGEYDISGECANGQIAVDVDKTLYTEEAVTLSLTGLTLSNDSAAPIYVAHIKKGCVISAKKNTVNTISDGSIHTDSYENSDGETKEINAAIFSREDLKFKGKGTLIVNGNADTGILSKEDIKIWNSTLTVNAVHVGIKGKESVRIGDPDETDYADLVVTVTTETGDGIKSTDDEDDSTGFVRINGGTVKVHSYSDCIQGESSVEINGGDIDLFAYEGSDYTGNGSSSTGNPGGGFGGFDRGGPGGGGFGDGNQNKTEDSAKGLKSGGNLTITGGTLNINTSDDCLHCADTLTVSGGTITAATADDGLHSDNYLIIDGGDITVTTSYEGIEAASLTVNDGNVHVNASDDGFNAAGNKTSLSDYTLTINGGYIYVRAEGDGLDSNGITNINGGTTIVQGPSVGGNSPLDSEHGIVYQGGIVLAVGYSGCMWSEDVVGNITGDSWINTNIGATDLITITDASGNVLSAFKPEITTTLGMVYMNSACASSSMQVYTGGTYSGTLNADGYGEGGTVTGGTQQTQNTTSSGNQGGGPSRGFRPQMMTPPEWNE